MRNLDELARVDITRVPREDLVDATSVPLESSLSQKQRAVYLLDALQNPYCFRVGDVGVKVEFTEGGPALHDLFSGFLARQKSGL